MPKEKREQILFSCLGSTDPVRGLHDGAMLHIVRHYRPTKIQWYITPEMKALSDQDHRYNRAMEVLRAQYPDYEPEILPPCYGDQMDASDFDAFYEPFTQELQRLSREYPEAELLINISSGTPQMKMTLALLAQTLQFRVRVVQVKNFEKRAGTAGRTTARDYDLECELELNEDALPEAENRCSEPKLIVIRREQRRTQIDSLLRRYDYEALLPLCSELPERITPLIRHLALRAAYDLEKAVDAAKAVGCMELYPAHRRDEDSYQEYQQMSEYLLTLKLMQRTQRYTEFVIRINPFVIRLQQAYLKAKGVDFASLSIQDYKKGMVIQREKVGRNHPELLTLLDSHFTGGFRDTPMNMILGNYFLEWQGLLGSADGKFFQKLEKLNSLARNGSAHSLSNTSEEDICRIVGCDSGAIIRTLTGLMAQVYPAHYDEALFSIYDVANKEILGAL